MAENQNGRNVAEQGASCEGHMCPHPGRGHGDGGSAGGSVGHAAGRGSRNMIVVPCYCSMLLFPDMVKANYRLHCIADWHVYPYELERAQGNENRNPCWRQRECLSRQAGMRLRILFSNSNLLRVWETTER